MREKPESARVLPLYEVIEEEYRQLGLLDPARNLDEENGERSPWRVRAQDLLDLQGLARLLVDPPRGARLSAQDEAVNWLKDDLADRRSSGEVELRTLGADIEAFGKSRRGVPVPKDPCARDESTEVALLRSRVAAWLTDLVTKGHALGELDAFHRIQLSPYAREAMRRNVFESNRLLLEAVLPGHITRIRDVRLNALQEAADASPAAALCLSGGGIRSASFALGVVQALSRRRLFDQFHYLSTVSGGGYLGGWLSAWMAHTSAANVQQALGCSSKRAIEPEPTPLKHLRSYGNFLSPRLGFFSADTWTLAATVIRNLILNWLVLVPLIMATVMVPWLAVTALGLDPGRPGGAIDEVGATVILFIMGGLGTVLGVVSLFYVHRHAPQARPARERLENHEPSAEKWRRPTQRQFVKWCLLPLTISAILLTTTWFWAQTNYLVSFPLIGSLMVTLPLRDHTTGGHTVNTLLRMVPFLIIGLAFYGAAWRVRRRRPGAPASRWYRKISEGLLNILTGISAGVLLYWAADRVVRAVELMGRPGDAGVWDLPPAAWYTVLSLPIYLGVLLLGHHVYVGITGNQLFGRATDPEREWAARFHAWVLIVAVGWFGFSAIVIVGPALFRGVVLPWIVSGAGAVAGVATAVLTRSGKSEGDKAREGKRSTAVNVALALTVPVFVVVLIAAFSAADLWLIHRVGEAFAEGTLPPSEWMPFSAAQSVTAFVPIGLFLALGLLGVVMGALIDTNKFSLHAMYRARLIRAFLGASRPAGARDPDPFTGFDEDDNLPMLDLWPAERRKRETRAGETLAGETLAGETRAGETRAGEAAAAGTRTPPDPAADGAPRRAAPRPPLHVLNMALNLVGGSNLAWRDRKAESFTVSSLHAGSLQLGYRRTSSPPPDKPFDETGRFYGGETGISLGTAMTISGAAANPSMGYHSSPAVTFLMTLFNARLGWWLGNPGPAGNSTWHLSSPRTSFGPIINELFGLTDDTSAYVHLSDGGHFDNLGLYEMVLRRCRYIVVADAGCDPNCALQDLGTAIRLIRIDLGINITFDNFPIYPRSGGKTGKYWALGKIHYCEAGAAEDGYLIYLKPAFYGDEPRDIFNYGQDSAAFPHEGTGDQFYSEAQFESYRALGEHAANWMMGDLPVGKSLKDLLEGHLKEAKMQSRTNGHHRFGGASKRSGVRPGRVKPSTPELIRAAPDPTR